MNKSNKKISSIIVLLILGLIYYFINPSNEIDTNNSYEKAYVTKVVDGDTIYADVGSYNEKIRFIGMNTPEINLIDGSDEPYGRDAFNYTKKLLTNKDVYLEMDVSDRDQYNRMLRIIWLENPNDIKNITYEDVRDKTMNGILVSGGYAYAHAYPPDFKYSDYFKKMQDEAIKNQMGMWGNNKTTTNKKIKGNVNSKIYHMPDGEHYNEVNEKNVIYFDSEEEAIDAGYKRAKN